DALDLLLRVASPACDADLVIEIGGPPTSMAYERHVAAHLELGRVRFAAYRPRDPQGSAEAVIVGDLAGTLASLVESLPAESRVDRAWIARLEGAERLAWSIVEREVAVFGESAVARAVV